MRLTLCLSWCWLLVSNQALPVIAAHVWNCHIHTITIHLPQLSKVSSLQIPLPVTLCYRIMPEKRHCQYRHVVGTYLLILLALELITVTHYFTKGLAGIWISYSVYKTEQPELFVVLEVSTYLLNSNSNFITCIGYPCAQFSVAAPRVWNSLPQELRNCETLGTFKKHLES